MTRAEKIEAAARALSRVLGEVATADPTVRWNMKSAVALSDAQRDLTTALAASPEVKPTGEGTRCPPGTPIWLRCGYCEVKFAYPGRDPECPKCGTKEGP